MNLFLRLTLINIISIVLISNTVLAESKNYYDRISLSAESSIDVNNDILVATLSTQKEGEKLSELSHQVNQTINDALKFLKEHKQIKRKTQNYQTTPVYKKQRLIGWRVKQSIQLKSKDISTLSKVIGDLQKKLALSSVSYEVSDEQRQTIEEELIAKAIDSFNNRAEQITQHLKRQKYRLVSMDVRTNSSPIRPIRYQGIKSMEMARATPTIEPGTQKLSVNVNGVIELELN